MESGYAPCQGCGAPVCVKHTWGRVSNCVRCVIKELYPDQERTYPKEEHMMTDNWKHRSARMKCDTCMWYVPKELTSDQAGPRVGLGRCRRRSPTMAGFPAVYDSDWCGDHKIDEEKA